MKHHWISDESPDRGAVRCQICGLEAKNTTQQVAAEKDVPCITGGLYGPKDHTYRWCSLCDVWTVVCGTCGNNACNGGEGSVDGEPCPDCESAWQLYQKGLKALDGLIPPPPTWWERIL